MNRTTIFKKFRVAPKLLIFVTVLVILFLAIIAFLALLKSKNFDQLKLNAQQQSLQYVTIIHPSIDISDNKIELPGSLQGFVEAPIYARTNGYLLKWYKDIGSSVNKGDVLAVLDTPEVDQQLIQAEASRSQADTTMALALSSVTRWEQLRLRDVVSQQELDERRSAYDQSKANVAAITAEVQRLNELVSFKKIVAPFQGKITKRNIDVGDLISSSSLDSAHALFTLSQIEKLRLYVSVPQTYAEKISVGQQVTVIQPEMPDRRFIGKIDRTAGAIDKDTRTMQVEVILDNKSGNLFPGAYVKVLLPIKPSNKFIIPANTILFRAEGASVAIVDDNNNVTIKSIKIGQDFGKKVEVVSGVTAEDRLVLNPSDSLETGDRVIPIKPLVK